MAGINLQFVCDSQVGSVWVCVSVSVFFFALVVVRVWISWGISAVLHSRCEVRRRRPGHGLSGSGSGGVSFEGHLQVCIGQGGDSWKVLAGWFSSSREGCTFLSPPTGCSSSALGSGKGPLERRPLSTLPSFVERDTEKFQFSNSRKGLFQVRHGVFVWAKSRSNYYNISASTTAGFWVVVWKSFISKFFYLTKEMLVACHEIWY